MAIDFARGVATQILGSELRKVAGGIGGAIRPSSQRPESPTEPLTRTKYSTDRLSFPLDIGDNPGVGEHGHYMLFFINEVQSAELGFGGGEGESGGDKTASSSYYEAKAQHSQPETVKEVDTKKTTVKTGLGTSTNLSNPGAVVTPITTTPTTSVDDLGAGSYGEYAKKKAEADNAQQTTPQEEQEIKDRNENEPEQKNTLYVKRAPTVRSKTVIQMYMPPNIQVAYKSDYGEAEIGTMGKAAIDIFDAATSAQGFTDKAKKTLDTLTQGVGDMTLGAILGAGDLVGGAGQAYQIGQGQILADRMELMFKGISHREFQYTFKMMPRNSEEAKEVYNICHAFKVNMLPEFGSDGRAGRRMNVPNTFNIHYMYYDKQNQYLDPISECVLTDFSVSYGGEGRFKTFDPDESGSPPPVETSISLTFEELELITRERVEDGRALGGQIGFGPSNPVNS